MRVLVLCIGLLSLASGCDRRVGAGIPPSGSSGQSSAEYDAAATNPADADVPDADNTAVNARDRDGSAPTPLDQGQDQPDINITAGIRRRVVEQPLSLNAHNVKIITQDGKVTLRGPVKSAKEKEQVERIAQEVAGPENVNNLLEVERN